jgi:putative transposase
VSGVSERISCQVLRVNRAGLHGIGETARRRREADPPWMERLRHWIQVHPTFGYRRLWVQLRFRDRLVVNRKAVYRVLKQQRWFVHQRVVPARRPHTVRMARGGSVGSARGRRLQ